MRGHFRRGDIDIDDTRRGCINVKGTYMKRRHTRRRDKGHIRRGDTLRGDYTEGSYTENGVRRERRGEIT